MKNSDCDEVSNYSEEFKFLKLPRVIKSKSRKGKRSFNYFETPWRPNKKVYTCKRTAESVFFERSPYKRVCKVIIGYQTVFNKATF